MRAYLRACLAPLTSAVVEAEGGAAALELLRAPDGARVAPEE